MRTWSSSFRRWSYQIKNKKKGEKKRKAYLIVGGVEQNRSKMVGLFFILKLKKKKTNLKLEKEEKTILNKKLMIKNNIFRK